MSLFCHLLNWVIVMGQELLLKNILNVTGERNKDIAAITPEPIYMDTDLRKMA